MSMNVDIERDFYEAEPRKEKRQKGGEKSRHYDFLLFLQPSTFIPSHMPIPFPGIAKKTEAKVRKPDNT